MINNTFDKGYRELGIRAQRMYPNEVMISFLAEQGYLFSDMKQKIRILELGCGSGANLWMLAKEGFDVYGIDASAAGLEVAQSHLKTKWGVSAHLQVGLFDDIPFEDNMFDVVIDVVSLQHLDLETSKSALKEIFRVLKTNGKFFSYRLSDHSVMYLNSDGNAIDSATVDEIANTCMPLNHNGVISFWGPQCVREQYELAKLEVLGIERYNRTYNGGLYKVGCIMKLNS